MNRKPGFPTSSSTITLPQFSKDDVSCGPSDPETHFKKRQQLISFGHNQWGFENWNWVVSKQELDFVDFSNGKFCAGVVAFVLVTVKSLGIHREDIGYATSVANQKGSAIHNARKSSVTNALRETLLGFGGNIASQLMEQLESTKNEMPPSHKDTSANNVPVKSNAAESSELRSAASSGDRKDSVESVGPTDGNQMKRDGRSPQKPNNQTASSSTVIPVPTGIPPQGVNQGNHVEKVNFPANQSKVNRFAGMPVKMGPTVAAVPPVSVPPVSVPPPTAPPPAPGVQPKPADSHQPTEEEIRAERKRRQKQKQEEFKLKQIHSSTAALVTEGHNVDKLDSVIIFSSQDSILEGEQSENVEIFKNLNSSWIQKESLQDIEPANKKTDGFKRSALQNVSPNKKKCVNNKLDLV